MADPLSDVIDLVGVRSSVYFQRDFCAPWATLNGRTGFAHFHIIVSGRAVALHDGSVIHLSSGDVLLFSSGVIHVISDHPETPAVDGEEVLAALRRGENPFSTGGIKTRLICGHFEYEIDPRHPLIQEIPAMVLLRRRDMPDADHLLSLVNLLIEESQTMLPGSNAVLRYLSGALLVLILRTHFKRSNQQNGFQAGLRDPRISRALHAIHSDTGSKMTLTRLAQTAGMSRSAFADAFKSTVGDSPGAYTARWKLLRAAQALRQTDLTIEAIAFSAGYQSSTAFSRAFQRLFGTTPRAHRRARPKPTAAPLE